LSASSFFRNSNAILRFSVIFSATRRARSNYAIGISFRIQIHLGIQDFLRSLSRI